MKKVRVFVLSVFAAVVFIAGVSVSSAEGLRHGITNDRPSDTWRSAPPLGNGVLGATPYGDPLDEIILLNHEALFYPLWFTPTADDIPNMAPHLPKVRELILQGNYGGADGYWNRKLSENNYGHERIPFTNPFHPLGDIAIKRFVDGEIKDYKQVLDFETGEAVASWTQKGAEYNRSAFVSRADDVVVVRLGSSLKKHGVTANICLARHMTDARVLPMEYRNHQIMPDTDILPMFMGKNKTYLHAKKTYGYEPIDYESEASDKYYVFYGKYPVDGRTFGAVARVTRTGGRQRLIKGQIEIVKATEVVIAVKIFANEKQPEPVISKLKNELAELTTDYNKLLARHVALHKPLFSTMELSLGASDEERKITSEKLMEIGTKEKTLPKALAERIFDFGRYSVIASSGDMPANLQGVWSGSWVPCWSSDYTININAQMNYWHAMTTNIAPTMMSYFKYFDSLMPDWKVNAKKFYGCRGMVAFVRHSDHGFLLQDAQWMFWTPGAAWLSQLYYDYYVFTEDKEFLKNRAVPFMKECALFYEDFVVMGPDGKYMFLPSHSPENIPEGHGRTRTTINATMDIAVTRELFTNLVAACETLGIEKEGVKRWKDFLSKLPDYMIAGNGRLKEWTTNKHRDKWRHRHMAHLYPIIPGHEIYADEGDPKIREGCRLVLEDKRKWGAEGNGFTYSYMSGGFARLGIADRAYEQLRGNALDCDRLNLFTRIGYPEKHDAGTVLIDGNGGFCSTVMDMLLYSLPGKLKVLGALPKEWPNGYANGMLARGGLTVDLQWDMKKRVVNMNITSKTAQKLELYFPSDIKNSKVTNAKSQPSSRGLNYLDVTVPSGKKVTLQVELKQKSKTQSQ